MPGTGPVNRPGSAGFDTFDNTKEITNTVEVITIVIEESEEKQVEELKTSSTDTGDYFRPAGDGSVEVAPLPVAGAGSNRELELFTATAAQTIFGLGETPLNVAKVVMRVNGVAYKPTVDYSVVGSTLTWADIVFVLETGDEVQVDYNF